MKPMIQVGAFNTLKVMRLMDFGAYLDDGREGILLPKRFMPSGLQPGDEISVFIYHDSEDRLIATTQQPAGVAGDIVYLPVVSTTPHGAFMDWGLMKDLFVPKSRQLTGMRVGGYYLVKIYIDEQTGRLTATEKFENQLSNEKLELTEKELVDLVVLRRTDIGYLVAINNRHTGVLHFNDIFQDISVGKRLKGFIKTIRPENKIDVSLGKPGFERVENEKDKLLRLLTEHNGYLPYNDKSDPEEIYAFFGMSKKTFKMAAGVLYKLRKIAFTQTGIKLIEPL